jgi:hypothetical protein
MQAGYTTRTNGRLSGSAQQQGWLADAVQKYGIKHVYS